MISIRTAMKFLALSVGVISLCIAGAAQTRNTSRIDVKLVTDEADAVLSILDKLRAKQGVTEADWQRVFASEGYVRLKRREASMKRPFTDDDFKTFVLSQSLLTKASPISETLRQWREADLTEAASLALEYLPATARIRAKVYPVIKPQSNSFVFEVTSDPAIFLYINPEQTKEQFINTVAHEFHHIGYGSSCPASELADVIHKQPKNIQNLMDWLSAFGEGFAMLAAAGGPDDHPHRYSSAADRARWDHDMTNFNSDLRKVEKFYLDIINDKLGDEEINKVGFSFFGVQGPWYTVGWKMAVVIEKQYGRARLVECMCDRRQLLRTYNEAATEYNRTAREPLVFWSATVVEATSLTR